MPFAGARVGYVDPLIEDWSARGVPVARTPDLEEALATADLAILLQPHRAFDLDLIAGRGSLVLDTRGVLPPSETVERL